MFQIKVEGIFKISGRGQVIWGTSSEQNYFGTIRCGDKVFKVLGSSPLGEKKGHATYILDTFELTNDYIGKVFVEEKRHD
jgi:hypothetical protein